MLIWRVEHPHDGCGPFTSAIPHDESMFLEARASLPEPDQDGLRMTADDVFGFAQERHLYYHFTVRDRGKMHRCGFHIVCYEVPQAVVSHGDSGQQVMFPRSAATHLYTRSLISTRSDHGVTPTLSGAEVFA